MSHTTSYLRLQDWKKQQLFPVFVEFKKNMDVVEVATLAADFINVSSRNKEITSKELQTLIKHLLPHWQYILNGDW